MSRGGATRDKSSMSTKEPLIMNNTNARLIATADETNGFRKAKKFFDDKKEDNVTIQQEKANKLNYFIGAIDPSSFA